MKLVAAASLVSMIVAMSALFLGPSFASGLGVGILIPAAILGSFWFRYRKVLSQENLPPPPRYVGDFDYAWTVDSLSRDVIPLDQYRGRVLFLNFWSTTCAPCVAELPEIVELAERKVSQLVCVCVSLERPSDVEKWLAATPRFSDASGLFFFSSAERIPQALRPPALPTTIVVGKTGTIVFSHVGASRWSDDNFFRFLEAVANQ